MSDPLVIAEQGSFAVGGIVTESAGDFDPHAFISPAGNTWHVDHAYVQYQVPVDARRLPIVLWHGGGQFAKTWDTTPDGREGYQSLLPRRGWATYAVDQPGRGRAGNASGGATDEPVHTDRSLWQIFRLGIWPDHFAGGQFPTDSATIDQYWRQVTPDTAPQSEEVVSASAVAPGAR